MLFLICMNNLRISDEFSGVADVRLDDGVHCDVLLPAEVFRTANESHEAVLCFRHCSTRTTHVILY